MNLLDFLFPPLCLSCRSRTPLPFFCSTCWELCSPVEPLGRCPLCFTEIEGDLCFPCKRRSHILPFHRAFVFEPAPVTRFLCREKGEGLAGFIFYQWVQLEWEIPDIVIPTPGMEPVAKAFASFLNYSSASPYPYYSKMDLSLFEEGQTFLILDEQSSFKTLRKFTHPLAETFPKKIFQLSLMDDDDPAFH